MLAGGAALQVIRNGVERNRGDPDLPIGAAGYRTFAADCLWLQTDLAWEAKEEAKVRRLVGFTVATDPRTIYFWLNGARILAYDFPAWRCQSDPQAPLAVQAGWRTAGANEALALLERGLKYHGDSAAFDLEMANICLYGLGDRHRAAAYYLRASGQPDAPDYAARIYARLHAEEIAGMTLTR